MFRSFSTIIIFVCVTRTVFALIPHHKSHCGQHEVLSSCANRVCDYQKCSEVGEPIECIRMSHRHCKRGCVCRQNYLRADNGTCILASQCPNALKCPKPNEYYDACPPQCPSRTCGVMDNRTACPEPLEVGDPRCPPGSCRCNVGFYRDSDGSCVTWNLCKTCPENETAVSCFQAKCERRDCSDLGQPVACVRIDPMFCTVGCLCQEGFLRNNNGTCIPINQCPEAQCEDNEEFDDCPPACPGEQCGVDPSVVLCLALPDDPTCEPACRCRVGYLRNNNGKCIPRNKCPPICGPNEVHDTCVKPCPPQRCDVDPRTVLCPPDQECQAGCRCLDGYLRYQSGFCVSRKQCEKSPSPPVKRPTRPPPSKC
ncbi:tenascin-like [Maniola hyperantus]|uniref:tenascin-like n=1 Tax=Aphantopus hyperantus TaxID=2795564 RepID=UPI00212D604B